MNQIVGLSSNILKSLGKWQDKCEGFLIGTAIGDAMGVPFEGLPPLENISREELFNDFVALPDESSFPPGTTSDDTQFTAQTMLSFHLNDGFEPKHLAELFCHRQGPKLNLIASGFVYGGQ